MEKIKVLYLESPTIMRRVELTDFEDGVAKLVGKKNYTMMSVNLAKSLYMATGMLEKTCGELQNGHAFSCPAVLFYHDGKSPQSFSSEDYLEVLRDIGLNHCWIKFSSKEEVL